MPPRKLVRLTAIALSMVLWLVALPSAMAEPIGTITEYPLTANPAPFDITSGPDGALWFTEVASQTIGRITIDGMITEYPLPADTAYPVSITSGPDGALWFTINNANKIGRITTDGIFTEYPLQTPENFPFDITSGPDGALWFTMYDGNKIGRITTDGIITEYQLDAFEGPDFITTGPDGALWFTESSGNVIGRITTSGQVNFYPFPPDVEAGPFGITSGPDGAVWFAEGGRNTIGRITTDGTLTEYPLPTGSAVPSGIITGPDGALWFTEQGGQKIGRITVDGTITEYPLPTAGQSRPSGITIGPDGGLWFTEYGGQKIGKLLLTGSDLTFTPGNGTTVTFANVSSAGKTSVTTNSSGPPLPAGFSLGDPPTYYDISMTGTYAPPVTVCIAYDSAQYSDPTDIHLLHYENNAWADVTTTNNTTDHVVCGEVTSLSPFVVAQSTQSTYRFTGFFQPIDTNQPNAAKAGQTIPVKWHLTDTNGIPISDPSSFVSVTSSPTSVGCSGTPDAIETYAGASGLQYLGDGNWQFNWKTPKTYAGQCRTMLLNLNDGGSGRTATFIFK